jgi:hypothetical protein
MQNEGNGDKNQNNNTSLDVKDDDADRKPMKGGKASLAVYLQLAYAVFFGIMFYVYTTDESYFGSELECVKLLAQGKEIFQYYVQLTIVCSLIVLYSIFCSKKSLVLDTFFDTFVSFIFIFFFVFRLVLLIHTAMAYVWGENCGSLNSLIMIWMIITFTTTFLFLYFLCCCCVCFGLSA